MALESDIQELNATGKALIVAFTTFAAAFAQFGNAPAAGADTTKPATTRRGKNKDDEQKSDYPLLPGDPEGTRYWVIEAHNTVYVQKPGDAEPGIEGAKIESSAHYLARKEEFAKKALTPAGNGTQTGAAASNTPSTTSSSAPAASQASGATFKQVVDACMALNAGTQPGQGREALKDFLMKHVGKDEQGKPKTVPALEKLGKNDALLAELNALLNPAAAATDENLFG